MRISTATAKEIVKKKSSITLGSGTMIIAIIDITKITIAKSFDSPSCASILLALVPVFVAFAKVYPRILEDVFKCHLF